MIKKTAQVSGTVKSIARQINNLIDSRTPFASSGDLTADNITGFNYDELLSQVPGGIDADGEYNVGKEERPMPSQDFLFNGINNSTDLTRKYNSAQKILEYAKRNERRFIGHDIGSLAKLSKSIFKMCKDVLNPRLNVGDVGTILSSSNSNTIDQRLSVFSSAICAKKYSLQNYVESMHGLEWGGKDDAWFIVVKIGWDLAVYVSQIKKYFNSLIRMDISQFEGSNDDDPELLRLIAHNANILEALSSFKKISDLLNCFESVSENIGSVADSVDFSSETQGGGKLTLKISKRNNANEDVEDGNRGDIIIKNLNNSNVITLKHINATKEQIKSAITTNQSPSAGKQIFVHEKLSSDSKLAISSTPGGSSKISIRLSATDKAQLAGEKIFIVFGGGRIIPRGDFELSGDTNESIQNGLSLAVEAVRSDDGNQASDGVFASSKKNEISKIGESTTQSTFYEISHGGKKITTTISEYIKNNGYYNVDGKKVKLKLSNAKPKGISNAKKRN